MHSIGLSSAEFEGAVADALDSLPKRFADLVENVAVAVEDEPGVDDLDSIRGGRGGNVELLGIYRGVALTQRGSAAPSLPGQIVIFRGPINRISGTRDEAVAQIRKTVIHEFGHYFGLNDDEMPH